MKIKFDSLIVILTSIILLIIPFVLILQGTHYGLYHLEVFILLIGLIMLGLLIGLILIYSPLFVKVLIYTVFIIFIELSSSVGLPKLSWLSHSELLTKILTQLLIFTSVFIILMFLGKNMKKLVFVISLVFLISLVFTPIYSNKKEVTVATKRVPNSKNPPYIHIVLDEHMGIEKIPKKYKDDILKTIAPRYLNQGFAYFENSYSKEISTLRSFANFLNFNSSQSAKLVLASSDKPYSNYLKKNTLFSTLNRQGYDIKVLQTAFLNLCSEELKNCNSNSYAPFEILFPDINISIDKKILIIVNAFLKRIKFYMVYNIIKEKFHLPVMELEQYSNNISMKGMFDFMINRISQAKENEAYFFHLLWPHVPYFTKKDCSEVDSIMHTLPKNTPDDKLDILYMQYVGQLLCTQQLMKKVLNAIETLENKGLNPIVIIHGDHGSRIYSWFRKGLADKISREDYFNTMYSTFFVVKHPNINAGKIDTLMAIDQLLKNIIYNKPILDKTSDNFVFRANKKYYFNQSLKTIKH